MDRLFICNADTSISSVALSVNPSTQRPFRRSPSHLPLTNTWVVVQRDPDEVTLAQHS